MRPAAFFRSILAGTKIFNTRLFLILSVSTVQINYNKKSTEVSMSDKERPEYPPMALIKTWVWMLVESNVPEIREKGRNNLISSFGSLANADDYISKILNKP